MSEGDDDILFDGEPTLSLRKLGMVLMSEQEGAVVGNIIDFVKAIHIFDFRGNTVGVDAAKRIAQSMAKVSTLKRVVFADMFTGRSRDEIPITLKYFSDAIIASKSEIIELNLSDNALGPTAIPGIQEFLFSRPCFTLERLALNNCGLGPAGITVAECLIKCHREALVAGKKFELKEFIAGRNRLEDAGAQNLAQAFRTIATLERIEMPQNGIRSTGIIQLAKAVGTLSKLRHLNLNDNTFDTNGARAMAHAIGNIDNCLEVVDFGDCLCRKGSVSVMEKILEAHSDTIREIDLTGNEIQAEEAFEIISISEQLPNLEILKLGTNAFGNAFEDLQAAIEEGEHTYIDLGDYDDDQGSLDDEDEDEEDDLSGDD